MPHAHGERVSLAMRFAIKPHHPCRSGSPDPDPFGSGRSRTTEVVSMPSGRRDLPVSMLPDLKETIYQISTAATPFSPEPTPYPQA